MRKYIIPLICYSAILVVLLNLDSITDFLAKAISSNQILNIADEIVLLSDGEIEAVGQKDEVLPLLLNRAKKPCKVMLDKGGNA